MSLKLKSELEAALSALWNKDKALLVAHNDAASGAHGMSVFGKQLIALTDSVAVRNALVMAPDHSVTFRSLILTENLNTSFALISKEATGADAGMGTGIQLDDPINRNYTIFSQHKDGSIKLFQNVGNTGWANIFTIDANHVVGFNYGIKAPSATINGVATAQEYRTSTTTAKQPTYRLATSPADPNFVTWVTNGQAEGGAGTVVSSIESVYSGQGTNAAIDFVRGGDATNGWIKLRGTGGLKVDGPIIAPSATFSGAIEAGGYSYFGKTDANAGIRTRQLAIRDDVIENYLTDSDTAGVSINYAGFNGANTRFRDFIVYNGKYGRLFKITGSTGVAEFSGRLTATDVLATKQGSDTDLGYKLGPDNWPQRNLIGHVYTEALGDHVVISVPRGETAESAKLKFTWRGALSGINNLYAENATISESLIALKGGRFAGGSSGPAPSADHVLIDAPSGDGFARIIGIKADGSLNLPIKIQPYGGETIFGGSVSAPSATINGALQLNGNLTTSANRAFNLLGAYTTININPDTGDQGQKASITGDDGRRKALALFHTSKLVGWIGDNIATAKGIYEFSVDFASFGVPITAPGVDIQKASTSTDAGGGPGVQFSDKVNSRYARLELGPDNKVRLFIIQGGNWTQVAIWG